MMKKNGNTIIYLFSALFLIAVAVALFYSIKKNNELAKHHDHHSHYAHSHCCSSGHAAHSHDKDGIPCPPDACEQEDHDHPSEDLTTTPEAETTLTSQIPQPDNLTSDHHTHHHCTQETNHTEQLDDQHSLDQLAAVTLNNELILIDCIMAKVGDQIITQSDVTRPGIDGEKHSLKELVEHAAIYEKAKKLGISLSKEMTEKNLKKAAEENNMTYAELLDSLKFAGLTEEELFKKFEALKAVEQLINYKVGSNSVVSEEDITSFYTNNPVKTTARYYLRVATVSYQTMTEKKDKENLKHELIAAINNKSTAITIPWGNPYWYEHDEINQAHDFIFNLTVGQTSMPYDNGSCFLIYRLEDKLHEQLVSLEERKQEIANTLFRQKWSLLMSELITDVNKDISISYV